MAITKNKTMQASNLVKVGRNERCPCGSERKYKVCCMAKESANKEQQLEEMLTLDQRAEPSDYMAVYRESLVCRYADHRVIEISNNLTALNFNIYQNKNAGKPIIMLAERKPSNQLVFDKRQGGADADAMVLYRGYHCLISYRNVRQSLCDIYAMIDARM
jgi:hypothetical protein